jgi:uncharacterized membrane protein
MGKQRHHQSDQRSGRRDQFVSVSSRARGGRRLLSWNALLVAGGLVLVAAVLFATRSQSPAAEAFTGVGERGGDISFPISDFADGQARFFKYVSASGKDVRFFVMRSADGVTRAAFDTCDVCFRERRGYRQAGDSMICNNCGQAFRSTSINEVKGGCNPAPLDRAIEGDRIVLRAAALEQGAFYF